MGGGGGGGDWDGGAGLLRNLMMWDRYSLVRNTVVDAAHILGKFQHSLHSSCWMQDSVITPSTLDQFSAQSKGGRDPKKSDTIFSLFFSFQLTL